MYDLLVFIGRFQPFHREHKRVIDAALDQAKNVLILIGSAGSARNIRNPFTYEERRTMIHDAFLDRDLTDPIPATGRIKFRPVFDKTYSDTAWVKQVQHLVSETALDIVNNGGFRLNGIGDMKIGLIGASKDHSSYYLKMFPQWGSVNVPLDHELHATDIREHFLENGMVADPSLLPTNVVDFLEKEFYGTKIWADLHFELQHAERYKEAWKAAPYAVKHLTVDAVVEQSGHILLVRRRSSPGKGLWALPGGHLEEYEKFTDGVIRELREETGIKVPVPVLRGSVKNSQMFDDPHRSNIGRVITYAQHIKLPDDVQLPKVKGMDDADKAKWVPVGDLREDMLFDDHFHIINFFLGAE